MQSFFFPVLWWHPGFEGDICGVPELRVIKRKWEVSIIDLYSLVAQRHPLGFPAELMHIFLGMVNLELEVQAEDIKKARDTLDCWRFAIYLRMLAPTVAPFSCNYSINQYAGINDRSVPILRNRMHEELRNGYTHDDIRVETSSYELQYNCIRTKQHENDNSLNEGVILNTIQDVKDWKRIEEKQPALRAARRAFVRAPLMPDLGSSILHCWQGLESLFPEANAEITFRKSLLLAELNSEINKRSSTFSEAKKSYKDRSRISHGSQQEVDLDQWSRAWELLRNALQSTLLRGYLPNEEELLSEILRD